MRGEVISVLSLERRYHIFTSERSERGTKYDIVTRAIKLILPSLECDNLFTKNQIIFSNYLYFEYILE